MPQEDLSNNNRQTPLTLLASSRHRTDTEHYHEEKLWRMRMIFFIVCAVLCFIITIGALTATIIVLFKTGNYFSLLLSSPISVDILFIRSFSKFLLSRDDLPINETRSQLQALEIEAGKQKSSKISRIVKRED
jgi:hypothetical protein